MCRSNQLLSPSGNLPNFKPSRKLSTYLAHLYNGQDTRETYIQNPYRQQHNNTGTIQFSEKTQYGTTTRANYRHRENNILVQPK